MPTDTNLDHTDSKYSFREYAKFVSPVVWVGDIPWHVSGRVLRPLSAPHVAIDVDREELGDAIAKSKALLACWTTQWDAFDSSEWWWTCCNHEEYNVENIDSTRGRRDIRKGLRECTVRRVPASEFSCLSYPIYRSAAEKYGNHPPTEMKYVKQVEQMAAYPGREFWAAFYEDKMAAFASCLLVDGAAVIASAKSAEEFHRYNPNAVLFYSISQYYLQNGQQYISNGWRTLLHPTSINKLLEKIGFRKMFSRVNIQLSPLANVIDKSQIAK